MAARLQVDLRPIGEGCEAAGHERVGSTDVHLALRAKVGLLREVLEHLSYLVGAGIGAVVDIRRHLQRLHVVAEGIKGIGDIVPRIRAAAHRERASIRQFVSRAECGSDGPPNLGDITGVDDP
jgi:hypothetical protein